MNILTTLKSWQDTRLSLKDKRVGFVPTMGNLHEGHLALCQRSLSENDITVVSIFVNPTQFNQTQDFQSYPRTLEEDCQKLKTLGVDFVLVPDANEIYPDHYTMQVSETHLSTDLEGACRPGHFSGMLTVVLKLLNLVQASNAYFGEKDYQQYLLIKKMASAFFLPVNIVPCPIVRAEDGLALSSRNSRLSESARQKAAHFPRLLQMNEPLSVIQAELSALGFMVEYLEERWGRRLGAVILDNVRLLDNVEI